MFGKPTRILLIGGLNGAGKTTLRGCSGAGMPHRVRMARRRMLRGRRMPAAKRGAAEGHDAANLPRLTRDDARRPAHPRGDAAVLWRRVWQRIEADYAYGAAAAEAVKGARERVAELVGIRSVTEIVLTSGATALNNTALMGAVQGQGGGDAASRPSIITCATENSAVLDVAAHLEASGAVDVTHVPVDEECLTDPADVEAAVTSWTSLISLMATNGVGTVHDIEAIGRIANDHGIVFRTDAAQAAGPMPVDAERTGIGMMSLSAHKMYGPKGIGVLYVRGLRPRVVARTPLRGGGQERGIRSGMLNVPGIVGFGTAAWIAALEMESENRRHATQASRMITAFEAAGELFNGHRTRRLARNVSVCFPGIEPRRHKLGVRGPGHIGRLCLHGAVGRAVAHPRGDGTRRAERPFVDTGGPRQVHHGRGCGQGCRPGRRRRRIARAAIG